MSTGLRFETNQPLRHDQGVRLFTADQAHAIMTRGVGLLSATEQQQFVRTYNLDPYLAISNARDQLAQGGPRGFIARVTQGYNAILNKNDRNAALRADEFWYASFRSLLPAVYRTPREIADWNLSVGFLTARREHRLRKSLEAQGISPQVQYV